MPFEESREYLVDILENIEFARATVASMSLEAFEQNKPAFYIVTRCLEIISEASRRLPPELREQYPNVQWRAIAASGNVYRHEYKLVQRSRLWTTVHINLDALEAAVRAELAALPEIGE